MHHLRLIKGLSYNGAVSATKDHPDVFVEDEKKYQRAMASGYFEEIEGAETPEKEADARHDAAGEEPEHDEPEGGSDALEDMNVTELKAYAALNGIDITDLKKKGEIIDAIKVAEKKADEARAALRQ